jgi:two-component system, chemotaxis family, CheB/CheR fusion protein
MDSHLPLPCRSRMNSTSDGCGGHRPLRVLVVDDHELTLQLMEVLLRTKGHSVVVAATLGGALKAIQQRTFDLVLTDLALPDGRGEEIIDAIHSMPPSSPAPRAVVISGYDSPKDIEHSIAVGFDAHLAKPITLEMIDSVLADTADSLGHYQSGS